MAKALTTQASYTPEQIQLIKNTVAVGATDDELKLFMQVAKNHRLDPFARQIHFAKRKVRNADGSWGERGTFQISVDGFRTLAARTGEYAGNDDPVFDNEAKPTKASVTVYRIVGGQRCPFTATARMAEYMPTNAKGEITSPLWRKMPHLMLGKCAETLALRKAFPEALSGLYSDEEMEQADRVVVEPEPEKTRPVLKPEVLDAEPPVDLNAHATAEQVTEIARLLKETHSDVDKFYQYAEEKFGVEKRLPTRRQAAQMLNVLAKKFAKMEQGIDDEAKRNS